MTDFRSLDHSTAKLFEGTLLKIKGKLEVGSMDPAKGVQLLMKFDELKKFSSVFVHKVTELKGRSGSFVLLLVEKHFTIVEHRKHRTIEREADEIEPMIVFTMAHDIGRAWIREETISDKINDLFARVDIDFSDFPGFSKNYYVVAEKPDEVRKHLPKRLMETLEQIPGMTIEINGNQALLRPEKNVTENVLLLLLGIGYKMTK